MRILWVTGAGGVVGGKVARLAAARGGYDRVCAFTHGASLLTVQGDATEGCIVWASLDIGDAEAVKEAAAVYPPDVIINPAAMTNVDVCEARRDDALRANALGPRHLAEVAKRYGGRLIHVSTDYVFAGDETQPGPYGEEDTPRPINWYGETKLAGERAVAEVCGDAVGYAIARTALVYDPDATARPNFVTWLVAELRAGRRVRIAHDQWNTPTHADDLAEALLWLAAHDGMGVYHVAGPDYVSRQEWALAIAWRYGLDTSLMTWVTSVELAQRAARPLRSGLRCERLHDEMVGQDAPRLRGIMA